MQFKEQGNKIQVHAYRGYDKEKRRAVVKMLGSIGIFDFKPSDGLLEDMTVEEKKELQSYIEKRRQESENLSRQYSVNQAASQIRKLASIVQAGDIEPPEGWGTDTWAALDELSKALRRAGFKKPAKTPKKAADAVLGGQAGLPLDPQ